MKAVITKREFSSQLALKITKIKGTRTMKTITLYEILGEEGSDKYISVFKSLIASNFTENEDILSRCQLFIHNNVSAEENL